MIDKLAHTWFGRLPVSGFLLPVLILGLTWERNLHRLPIENVLPTIFTILGLSLILLVLARVFSRNWTQAGIIQTIFLVYFIFADNLASFFSFPVLEMVIMGALFFITVDVIRRTPSDPQKTANINFALSLALFLPTTLILLMISLHYVGQSSSQKHLAEHTPRFLGDAVKKSPDVWHLVFDRYGGLEPLRRSYSYDNSNFLEELATRGFNVVEPAFANYQRTTHSLASSLNAVYLDEFARTAGIRSYDQTPLIRSITNNAALKFFNEQHYETIFSGSWWDATQRSPIATRNVNTRALPDIGRVFFSQTVFGKIGSLTGMPFGNSRKDQCTRVKYKFDELRDLAQQNNQKYVFGHFLIPHPPYVINGDGTCKTLKQAELATRRDNYVGQLDYTNREILKLVDSILSGPRPATIIVTSDEGPWPYPYIGDERFIGRDAISVNWADLDETQLQEKMGIILAVYMNGASREEFPTTPVNIYPAVLNHGFSGKMKFQPKRNYIFESNSELYNFTDVANLIEAP